MKKAKDKAANKSIDHRERKRGDLENTGSFLSLVLLGRGCRELRNLSGGGIGRVKGGGHAWAPTLRKMGRKFQ